MVIQDILFATKEQTMSLQKSGGYYTFLDQFVRFSLNQGIDRRLNEL